MFWNACIETSGSWKKMGASTPCLVPLFHAVLQVQAQKPHMHCFKVSALNAFPIQEFLVGSGIGIWAMLVPLVACPSCGLLPPFHRPPWSPWRLSPFSSPPTVLNHAHPSTSCLHPSITSGIWLLTQLPALLGAQA